MKASRIMLIARLIICLIGAIANLQAGARVVTTDQPSATAAKEGHRYAPDTVSGLGYAQENSSSLGKLVAAPPKRVSVQIQLGLENLYGLQRPQDLKQAGYQFMLANTKGDPQAPTAVALCTLMGCYGTPDRRSVAVWIEQASVREPAKAKLLEWASAEKWSDSTPRNRTATLLREAVTLQDPVALNELGLQQLASDQRAAALKSFESAAKRGSSAGARNFNLLIQQRDAGSSISSSGRADAQPHAQAFVLPGQSLYEQAKRYHAGQGLPVNDVQAIELYKQAADLGHMQAKRMLALIFSRLDAKGSLDAQWMRLLAQQHIAPMTHEAQPAAFWPQKDISLLADWLPRN